MEHGLFTLLFVLDPVIQILKSFTVTVDDMSLYYLKSKTGVSSTSENMVNSTLPLDVCD